MTESEAGVPAPDINALFEQVVATCSRDALVLIGQLHGIHATEVRRRQAAEAEVARLRGELAEANERADVWCQTARDEQSKRYEAEAEIALMGEPRDQPGIGDGKPVVRTIRCGPWRSPTMRPVEPGKEQQ